MPDLIEGGIIHPYGDGGAIHTLPLVAEGEAPLLLTSS